MDYEYIDQIVHDFTRRSRYSLRREEVEIEMSVAPHVQPKRLPPLMQAIYCFDVNDRPLKVGRAGPLSNARYTSQHYNPGSCQSNLAWSILRAPDLLKSACPLDMHHSIDRILWGSVGSWIKRHTTRVNVLLPAKAGRDALMELERFVLNRLTPLFEGARA